MKLIIDRNCTKKGFYIIQFGPDFDISIYEESIWINKLSKETMADIDKIVTGSVDLKFCVLHIKHPLLLENTIEKENEFFGLDYKSKLRNYFAVRLQHRRFPIDLYEIGKRLF